MGSAAVNAARAVQYTGAGTVEFILDREVFLFFVFFFCFCFFGFCFCFCFSFGFFLGFFSEFFEFFGFFFGVVFLLWNFILCAHLFFFVDRRILFYGNEHPSSGSLKL